MKHILDIFGSKKSADVNKESGGVYSEEEQMGNHIDSANTKTAMRIEYRHEAQMGKLWVEKERGYK